MTTTSGFESLAYFYDVNTFLDYNAKFVINTTQSTINLTNQTSKLLMKLFDNVIQLGTPQEGDVSKERKMALEAFEA